VGEPYVDPERKGQDPTGRKKKRDPKRRTKREKLRVSRVHSSDMDH
jgi:hypothetical protein